MKTSKFLSFGLALVLTAVFALPVFAEDEMNSSAPQAAEQQPISSLEPSLMEPEQEEEKALALASDYIANINYNLTHFAVKLSNGHLLVCRVGSWDPGVVEVDALGNEVWYYRGIQANSAQRLDNGNTLVADSGAPGAPSVPQVVELTPEGKKAWEYTLPSAAYAPRYAERLSNGNTLMVLPFEIREVTPQKEIAWQYGLGKPGKSGTAGYLEHPVRAHRLPNGNILIVDRGYTKGRVLEVTPDQKTVWQFAAAGGTGTQPPGLVQPLDALRMEDGTTWVTDKKQDMVFKLDAGGQVMEVKTWVELYQAAPVTNLWSAKPVGNGNVLLAATMVTGRTRVAEVIGDTMKVVWSRENPQPEEE
ncbi:hypothetical protein [Desulforamulus ruminis]|uniref:hypothetical protein n=1 Tax=Desulforamulus ruminis TaxID=1564 RepID=UPI002355356C|nr:hypothetical protein [Desulforamulus ruminis]